MSKEIEYTPEFLLWWNRNYANGFCSKMSKDKDIVLTTLKDIQSYGIEEKHISAIMSYLGKAEVDEEPFPLARLLDCLDHLTVMRIAAFMKEHKLKWINFCALCLKTAPLPFRCRIGHEYELESAIAEVIASAIALVFSNNSEKTEKMFLSANEKLCKFNKYRSYKEYWWRDYGNPKVLNWWELSAWENPSLALQNALNLERGWDTEHVAEQARDEEILKYFFVKILNGEKCFL